MNRLSALASLALLVLIALAIERISTGLPLWWTKLPIVILLAIAALRGWNARIR